MQLNQIVSSPRKETIGPGCDSNSARAIPDERTLKKVEASPSTAPAYPKTTQSAGEQTAAGAVYGSIKSEEVEYAAYGALTGVELLSQYKNWMAAQWMALPEETRAEWEASMKGEKEDMGDAMLSLLGF